ncbi:MAG TPA: cation-translocating P-type ATPase [Anaerolineales bacterium]|nr:cation-translocating P-type ATPase [Anaerolineales bacterium]
MVKALTCSLCGLTTRFPLQDAQGASYCCHACLEVAQLLANSPAPAETPPTAPGSAELLELTLGNLWCPSCAWLVSEQLRRTPGVISADVNFIQQQAQISYQKQATNETKLRKRVRALGYQASLPNETHHDEEESLFMRLIGCAPLVLHDVIVSFSIYIRDMLGWNTPDVQWLIHFFQIMMLLSSIPVVLLLGIPILRAGFASLLRGQPNLHTLITLGTLSALGLSIYNLVRGSGNYYFDTASMLIYLVAIGHWLEIRAHKTSQSAVNDLLAQLPQTANIRTINGEETLPTAQLAVGMRLVVRPGEHFAADGLIAEGTGDVNESLLTGEPKPVFCQAGSAVKAGTICVDGMFEVIISAVGTHTTAGQIGELLRQAIWQRSPLERWADKLSAWLTPLASVLALLAFGYWYFHGGLEHALMVALSVLLIACPCALGLATPLTLWLSLGRAAQAGVILRSTAALEQLAKVEQVYFDKTGTLTRLPLQVQAVLAVPGAETALLQNAADIEQASEHPLAQAILQYCQANGVQPAGVRDFRATAGFGVSGISVSAGEALWLGNRHWLEKQGLIVPDLLGKQAAEWQEWGRLVVYVANARQVLGCLALGETPRADTLALFNALQAQELRLAILTGDDPHAGKYWQAQWKIPVFAGLTPQDKMTFLQAGETAMIGDGINDTLALAAASVGITLSHGAQLAQSTADVILVNDSLLRIAWLFRLAKSARQRVKQNLWWALIYNLIGVGIAMCGLLQPLFAALAMVLSSFFVTANALRMKQFPLEEPSGGQALST